MAQGQNTVLIVEDSPVQAASIGQLLQQNGLRVLHAQNGRAGVEMAQQYLPDAIVLDLEMPEMNGLQVCERLKRSRETARIPIIILTCHDEPEMVTLSLQSGAIEYILKDAFVDMVLLETLGQMGLTTGNGATAQK